MDINLIQKRATRTIVRNAPSILTAMAVVGVISTVVMAVKATPKALLVLEAEERFREEEGNQPKIDILDKIDLTWKIYLPTTLMGITTICCIVGSNHVSTRRNAALISLIGIAESTLKEYQEKVIETIGERKEETIRSALAQDHIDQNPVKGSTVILTGKGSYLCYDNFSKRYFHSDIEAIRKAMNEFNRKLNIEGWLDINYLYDLLGLEPIELGDEYGWIAEKGLLDFKYDSRLSKDSEEPTLVLSYRVSPKYI